MFGIYSSVLQVLNLKGNFIIKIFHNAEDEFFGVFLSLFTIILIWLGLLEHIP